MTGGRRAGSASGSEPGALYSLCGACLAIAADGLWTAWNYDAAGEPTVPATADPSVYRCPACGYDHVDDDADPGVWTGSHLTMAAERRELGREQGVPPPAAREGV